MKKTIKKRAVSKRSNLYKLTNRWKLSHQSHSGRLLPHAHTSYPILAMIVLCAGVLMSGLSQVSQAAAPNDIVVSARLNGPAPTVAATIDSPTDGARISAKPITVTGSCPADTYVELLRNGVPSGVALCQADLIYTLQTDLFSGSNALQAQVYNRTDVPGPISATVTVYYELPVPPVVTPTDPPTTPTSPTTPITTPTPSKPGTPRPNTNTGPTTTAPVAPLLLQSDFNFVGHYAGAPASFTYSVSGGRAPYAISINWGDGSQKLMTVPSSGPFTVEHTYETPGGYQGSYPISVSAADADGTTTILQMLTIVTAGKGAGAASTQPPASSPLAGITGDSIRALIWSAYMLVVLMVLSFWLGERHEINIIRNRPGRSHRA